MRYFILGLLFFSALLRIAASQSPLCAYIYYAEHERVYVGDNAIHRVQEIKLDDFSSREYALSLSDDDVYRDVAYSQNPDMYLLYEQDESLGDAYGFYLNVPREGAEHMGDLFFVDNTRHLTQRWIDNTFIGHVGAAWSGDGRLAYAWNNDENGNEIVDDYTIHLAIYNPLTGSRETNSFVNTEPDMPLWILGWSADKRYFALLEGNYGLYEYRKDYGFSDEARIRIISAETLQAVPLATGESLTAESFAWSPNGSGFAYTVGHQVFVGTVEASAYESYRFSEDEMEEGYYERLQPEWSPDGRYLAISKADMDYHWSHLLIDTLHAESREIAGHDSYIDNLHPLLAWSGDSQRWLYPLVNRRDSYRWMAYDMVGEREVVVAEAMSPNFSTSFSDGLYFYGWGSRGFVGQAALLAILSPMHESYRLQSMHETYRVQIIRDGRETISLLENVKLVDMRWTANQEYLLVISSEGSFEAGDYRMILHWFSADGRALGTYESEILVIGDSVSEPYPAALILSRNGLNFEAILLNLESNTLITLVEEEESEGSPYGYWNADWDLTIPNEDYIELYFVQPFPIFWDGSYFLRSDGTIPEFNLSNATWTEDGSRAVLAEYHWIGEDIYSQTLESIGLSIVETNGAILWEETLTAEEYPYSWFWESCGIYEELLANP